MLAVVVELLDLMVSMELLATLLALVFLDHLVLPLVEPLVVLVDRVAAMVHLVHLDPLDLLVVAVAMVQVDLLVRLVHLDNLVVLVRRDNHSDKDHRKRIEILKEIEERGERVTEVGQNRVVVLDRSGTVTSQYHTSSRDLLVREEKDALVDLVDLAVAVVAAVAADQVDLVVAAVAAAQVAAVVPLVLAAVVALAAWAVKVVKVVTAVPLDMMALVVLKASLVLQPLVVDGTTRQEIS